MPYDEELANRIRELLADQPGVTEKAMFGGLAFLLGGHMTVAASRSGGLMVRVGREATGEALAKQHTELVEMRGRPMPGWIRVGPDGLRTKRELGWWVGRAVAVAQRLPPKG